MTKKILASRPIPLSVCPPVFTNLILSFFLTTLYIILDIHQPPTLSSVEKIDDREDGTICFFPLKAGACFSKVPKLFGRISGDIILFVS